MTDDEPLFPVPGWTGGNVPASHPVADGTPTPLGGRPRGDKRLIIGLVVAIAVVATIVTVVTQFGDADKAQERNPAVPSYSDASDNLPNRDSTVDSSAQPRTAATTGTSSAENAITFDRMRDLVYTHYQDLPGNPAATWKRIDPNLSGRLGWQDYVDFWNSIASVRVVSVTPRDATSVVVRLTYVTRKGTVDTEDRWLSFVASDGELRVFDSVRIRSVG